MIGIDTNILLRFVLNDDARQAKKVRDFFLDCEKKKNKLFLSTAALLESIWLLQHRYEYLPQDILALFDHLLELQFLEIENMDALSEMLVSHDVWEIDLADSLIGFIGLLNECSTTVTFDKKAAKISPNFTLL